MGTFTILGLNAFVLVNPGSTCLFISYEFSLKSHSDIEPLGHNLGVYMPAGGTVIVKDRKSTRLNSSHSGESRMPSSA